MEENIFCKKTDLRNESDVEQFFAIRLLKELGFKDSNILTKFTIPKHLIGKGAKKKEHRPDYAIKIGNTWVMIVEVKTPKNNIDEYVQEAQDYATIINRGYIGEDPVKFCLITNGLKTKLVLFNQNKPLVELSFSDFQKDNNEFIKLSELISYNKIKDNIKYRQENIFEFREPDIEELKGIFQICHNIIRNKHKYSPKKAFYEFTKLLFIKLNEDKQIHEKLAKGESVNKDDFIFSIDWIDKQRRSDNPFNEILFVKYRNNLEEEIENNKKRRIFQANEQLMLSSSTIKEIVKLLEHLDLKSVEEDLNGRVFETFLNAVIKGKELGQFFTPRSVVKFMVKMANLKISYDKEKEEYQPDLILDGCCGTGGFLIFALDDLIKKADKIPTNKKKLKEKIKSECIFGVDASEEEIIYIARMNMYIHGDGGSHMFMADTLDKDMVIERGINKEIANEIDDLRGILKNTKFDVILTNPPFSLKYKTNNETALRILKQYELAYIYGKNNSSKIRSLNSNVMFIERYWELLKPNGKLLTVIDDSVLNTDSHRDIRNFIRNKFIIKAIISLPKNTFVNADAGVKTSILYLIKKEKEAEPQPEVFMAISDNIGHNDAGKPTPRLNDLPKILESFEKFERGEQ